MYPHVDIARHVLNRRAQVSNVAVRVNDGTVELGRERIIGKRPDQPAQRLD